MNVRVAYVPPKRAVHRDIHATMRRLRVLERIGAVVDRVRLPGRLTYRLKECAGEENAWYAPEAQTVTFCYELAAAIARTAPRRRSPAGVTHREALIGPVAQILLHESAHALFHLLGVPILGREEDAADQVASFATLHLGAREAKVIVDGSAYFFANSAGDEPADKGSYADVHGLSWQRFYNLTCLAYGSGAKDFLRLVAKGYLPKERAEGCGEEYDQVAFAFRRLIGPHLRAPAGVAGGAR